MFLVFRVLRVCVFVVGFLFLGLVFCQGLGVSGLGLSRVFVF